MAARRCSECGISYPDTSPFLRCPIHDVETSYFANVEPDEDWKERADALHKELQALELPELPFPVVPGVEVIEEDGKLYVSQMDLWNAGAHLSRMQPEHFYLFKLEDGWVYETQGWHESGRRWWVERVIREDGPDTEAWAYELYGYHGPGDVGA